MTAAQPIPLHVKGKFPYSGRFLWKLWEKIVSLFFRFLCVYQRSHSTVMTLHLSFQFQFRLGSFIKRRFGTNALGVRANSINSLQNKLDVLSARLDDVNGYISYPANRNLHFQQCRRQMNYQRNRAPDYIASHHIYIYIYDSSLPATVDLYNITLNNYFFRPIASSQFRLHKDGSKRHKASDGRRRYWLSLHFAPKPMSRASARRLSSDIAADEDLQGCDGVVRLLLMSLITFSFPGDFMR